MHNLNLYRYYDKSLSDINRETLETLQNKPKRVAKQKLSTKVIIAAAVAIVSGLSVVMYFGVFSKKVVEAVEAPPPIDTRTEEEKQGYVQIQIFEFADAPIETINKPVSVSDIANDNAETDKAKQITAENIQKPAGMVIAKNENIDKKEESKKQVAKAASSRQEKKDKPTLPVPAPAAVSAPVVKTYSILFENINENEYERVKDLSEKNNTKLELVDVYSNYYSIWKVYEKSDTGSEMLDLEKVNHIEDFLTQDDAIDYAKKRNLNVLIKQIGVTEKMYTAKLCCSELDAAKQIAQNSNITDKIIKIVRAE